MRFLLLLVAVASASAYQDAKSSARPLVWGVDLGNHNSVAATASKAGVEVVLNEMAGRSVPSAVFYAGNARLVGEHTVTSCSSNPANLVNNLKVLLPRKTEGAPDDVAAKEVGAVAADEEKEFDAETIPKTEILETEMEEFGPSTWPAWAALAYRLRQKTPSKKEEEKTHFFDDKKEEKEPEVETVLPRAVVRHGGDELEVSACDALGTLMAHMERLAEADGGVRSSCVVAGVPSHYTRKQRQILRDAAKVQNIPLIALIDEGVAAALAYGTFKRNLPPPPARAFKSNSQKAFDSSSSNLKASAKTIANALSARAAASAARDDVSGGSSERSNSENTKEKAEGSGPLVVAFVDIGHTCTQVTIAAFTTAGLDILGRGCAENCGVGTMERLITDKLRETATKAVGAAAASTPRAVFRLSRAAAAAVKTLSANLEARACVECLDGATDVTVRLAREEVESECAGLSQGIVLACRQALKAADLSADDVDAVELLGGGSYVPCLHRAVESVFISPEKETGKGKGINVPVRRTMNSAESVATGCALAAARHSALFKLRPFAVSDRLGRGLEVFCSWRPAAAGSSTGGAPGHESSYSAVDNEPTPLLSIPAGSVIPSSTELRVPEALFHANGAKPSSQQLDENETTVCSAAINKSGSASGSSSCDATNAGDAASSVRSGSSASTSTKTHANEQRREEDVLAGSGGGCVLEITVSEGKETVAVFAIDVPATPTRVELAPGGTAARREGAAVREPSREVVFTLRVDEFSDVIVEHAREEMVLPRQGTSSPTSSSDAGKSGPDDDSVELSAGAAAKKNDDSQKSNAAFGAAASSGGGGRGLGRALHTRHTFTGLLSEEELAAAVRREAVLREQDRAAMEAAEARNALEDLLYATRRRLQPLPADATVGGSASAGVGNYADDTRVGLTGREDGDLSQYLSAREAKMALERLNEVEEALRGTLDKQACQALASELQTLTSAAEERRRSFLELLSVLEDFEQALLIREHRFYAASEKLSPADRRRLQRELASAQGWVTASRNRLEALEESARREGQLAGSGSASSYGARAGKLPLTSASVRRKLEGLMSVLDAVLPSSLADDAPAER